MLLPQNMVSMGGQPPFAALRTNACFAGAVSTGRGIREISTILESPPRPLEGSG